MSAGRQEYPRFGTTGMGPRVLTKDWAATALGPIEQWPAGLRSAVDLMLECGFAATLQWGPELILLYNDAYVPLIGNRHPAALGRPILEMFPEIRSAYEPIVKRVWNGETVVLEDLLYTYERNQGLEDGWFSLSHSPVRREDGSVGGILVVGFETTAQRRAERQREALRAELERSNEDLSRFSYTVSHDLQAPIRTVRAMTQMLGRKGESRLNDEQRGLIEMIGTAVGGMERLVSSMLEFAQVGHGQIQRETFPVGNVVETVELRLHTLIVESGAAIRCGKLPVVTADRVQMEQVFQNLLENAIQYRRRGQAPEISIGSAQGEGGWIFSVEDNGEGIPAESREQVFEPLKRLHGNEAPGTGLGLALCRRIIERHGGRIWVESGGAGKGSAFRFFLPA